MSEGLPSVKGGTLRPSVGDRVRAARTRLGWSREALAYRSGLSWSGVEQIESGRRKKARPETLAALAKALGVTIDYLVHGGSPPTTMLTHQALLYKNEEEFVAAAGPFLSEGVERSEGVLAVTTKGNLEVLTDFLGSNHRVMFIESKTWLGTPGAALDAFRAFVNDNITAGAPWARIIGEPIWDGRSDGEVRSWVQYESLLNLAFSSLPVTFLCPYDVSSLDQSTANTAWLTHPEIVSDSEAAANPRYRDPGELILGG